MYDDYQIAFKTKSTYKIGHNSAICRTFRMPVCPEIVFNLPFKNNL